MGEGELLRLLLGWGLTATLLTAAGLALVRAIFGLALSLRWLAALGASLVLLVALAEGEALTGSWWGLLEADIAGLIWSHGAGPALALQGLGLLLIMGPLWVAPIGALVTLAGFATTGHVIGQGGAGLSLVLGLHLVVAAIWVGILWPLWRATTQGGDEAARLGAAFGRMMALLLPVLFVAGIWVAYALLGSLSALWETRYGQVLSVKLGLVLFMLGLGAINRLALVPALSVGRDSARGALRRVLVVEAAFACLIIAVTVWLTETERMLSG